jgi:hypothetical protein
MITREIAKVIWLWKNSSSQQWRRKSKKRRKMEVQVGNPLINQMIAQRWKLKSTSARE